jgi:hypothetical protein
MELPSKTDFLNKTTCRAMKWWQGLAEASATLCTAVNTRMAISEHVPICPSIHTSSSLLYLAGEQEMLALLEQKDAELAKLQKQVLYPCSV